jgi:hypothetical protein
MNYQALIDGLNAELAGNGAAQTACNGNPDTTVDMSGEVRRLQLRAVDIEADIIVYRSQLPQ